MTASGLAGSLTLKDEVTDFKRRRIREEACRLFYQEGYENATLEAVAKKLQITKPSIYQHYANKGELLFDICKTGISLSLEAVEQTVVLRATSLQRLVALIESVLRIIFDYQEFIVVYTREEKHLDRAQARAIRELRSAFDHKLGTLLAEGDSADELSVEDPVLTATTIGGIMTWVSLWYSPSGKRTQVEITTHIKEMILRLVRASDAPKNLKTADAQTIVSLTGQTVKGESDD
jgi:AcrR family transcriptional regulator